MKNCIVYSVNNDKKSIYYLLYSVSSLKYHKNNIEIYLLVDTDFKENYKEFILNVFNDIKIIYIDHNDLFNHDTNLKLTINNHYRFAILKNCYIKNYDNVLYLDIDTEIYSDISSIFNVQTNDFQFWGNVFSTDRSNVHDSKYIIKRISSFIEEKNIKKLTFSYDTFIGYCNAGVLLIKQNKMNKLIDSNELFKLFDYYLQYNFHYPNQDIINYIFNSKEYNKYQFRLPTQYDYFSWTNTCSSISENNIIIKHYPGDKRKMKCDKFDITNGLIKNILQLD